MNIAFMAPRREVLGYISGTKSRVGDLILPREDNGNEVLYDIRISSPRQISLINHSAQRRGYTAQRAVKEKLTHREADPENENRINTSHGKVMFRPITFETIGGMAMNSKVLLHRIASEWERILSIPSSIALNYMIKQLGVCIQRGNSRCISSWLIRLQCNSDLEDTRQDDNDSTLEDLDVEYSSSDCEFYDDTWLEDSDISPIICS